MWSTGAGMGSSSQGARGAWQPRATYGEISRQKSLLHRADYTSHHPPPLCLLAPIPIPSLSLSHPHPHPFISHPTPLHPIPSHPTPPWQCLVAGFPLAGRELAKPRASSDIFCHRGVCPSPTSGLRDVIYADLIGVGLIGSSSSHMCWEGARESIKGSLHITGIFLHLLSAAPHVHFREPGHSSMRWEYLLRVLTMGTLLECNEVDS